MTITELLDHYNVPTAPAGHHHVSQGWIGIDCPYCSKGRSKFRLGVHLGTLKANCWQCGRLPLIQTLTDLSGEPIESIRRLLSGIERSETVFRPIRQGKLILPNGIGSLLPVHRLYLERRGFDPDKLATEWRLQGIGIAVRLAWRIFIPITLDEKVVSWTTRAVSEKAELRYISAKAEEEEFPAKRILYGADKAKHGVIVVEGPADAWRIGPGAVATLGVGWSRAQLRRIAEFPSRCVCFDNEPKAQERAMNLCRELMVFPGQTFVAKLKSKDPGSASEMEIKELRKRFL